MTWTNIDLNSLPTGEVLALSADGELMLGDIEMVCLDDSGIENCPTCFNSLESLHWIVKYIPVEDLVKAAK